MNHRPRTDRRPVSTGRLPRLRHQEALIRNEIRRLARHRDLPDPQLDAMPPLLMENAPRVEGPLLQR